MFFLVPAHPGSPGQRGCKTVVVIVIVIRWSIFFVSGMTIMNYESSSILIGVTREFSY